MLLLQVWEFGLMFFGVSTDVDFSAAFDGVVVGEDGLRRIGQLAGEGVLMPRGSGLIGRHDPFQWFAPLGIYGWWAGDAIVAYNKGPG